MHRILFAIGGLVTSALSVVVVAESLTPAPGPAPTTNAVIVAPNSGPPAFFYDAKGRLNSTYRPGKMVFVVRVPDDRTMQVIGGRAYFQPNAFAMTPDALVNVEAEWSDGKKFAHAWQQPGTVSTRWDNRTGYDAVWIP